MSLVTKSITGLVQGMSQQTPMGRSPQHLDLQVNAISSALRGLGKRPGSYLAGTLGAVGSGNECWHLIDRDATEQYILKADASGLSVWDLEGNQKTVTYEGSSKSYLECADPRQDLRLLTVNDYTFILNKTKAVEISPKVDLNGDVFKSALAFHPMDSDWLVTLVVPNRVNGGGGWKTSSLTGFSSTTYDVQLKAMHFGTVKEARDWFRNTYIPSFFGPLEVWNYEPEAPDGSYEEDWRGLTGSVSASQNIDNAYATYGITNPTANKLKLNIGFSKLLQYPGPVTNYFPGFIVSGPFGYYQFKAEFAYLTRPRDTSTFYGPGLTPDMGNLYFADYPAEAGLKSLGVPFRFNGFTVNGVTHIEPQGTYLSDEDRPGWWFNYFTANWPSSVVTMGGSTVYVANPDLTIRSLRPGFATVTYEYVKPKDKVFIIIKQGVAEQTYRVSVNGKLAEYTTGATDQPATYKTEKVAQELAADLQAHAEFVVEVYGRLVVVSAANNSTDLTFDFMDTWNSQAMYVTKNRVQAFTDLPQTFIEQHPVEVVGEGGVEGYYVRYTKSRLNEGSSTDPTNTSSVIPVAHGTWTALEGNEVGIWEECTARGLQNYLEETTMPHALVRNADGTFTLKALPWSHRAVGDVKTGPMPSFVGQSIKDIFFWRGRMGFLSNDSLVMSRSGEFFNLFPRSVKDVLDSDPIDIDVTVSRAASLLYAVPFNTSLLVFSDRGQYQVTANGVLTPRTISVQPTLEYQVSSTLRPINMGEAVVFGSKRGSKLSVFETEVVPNQFLTSATDVTLHVPELIPASIYKIAQNNVGNMLVATDGSSGTLWVYQYLWQGDTKVQEAWHYWTLPGHVQYAEFIDSKLYLVVAHNGVNKLLLIETREHYKDAVVGRPVHLDFIERTGGSVTGVPFEMRVRMSPIFLRNSEGRAVPSAVMKLRNVAFHQTPETQAYTVSVTPKLRATKTYPFDPERSKHRVPVLGSSVETTIEVTSTEDAECFIEGFSYEAELVTRARGI